MRVDNNITTYPKIASGLAAREIAEIIQKHGLKPVPLKQKKPFLKHFNKRNITADNRVWDEPGVDGCGILTGTSITVIDCDVRPPWSGPDLWTHICQAYGWPEGLKVPTPSGGVHHIYQAEPRLKQKPLFPHSLLDVKGAVQPDDGPPYPAGQIRVYPTQGGQIPRMTEDMANTLQNILNRRRSKSQAKFKELMEACVQGTENRHDILTTLAACGVFYNDEENLLTACCHWFNGTFSKGPLPDDRLQDDILHALGMKNFVENEFEEPDTSKLLKLIETYRYDPDLKASFTEQPDGSLELIDNLDRWLDRCIGDNMLKGDTYHPRAHLKALCTSLEAQEDYQVYVVRRWFKEAEELYRKYLDDVDLDTLTEPPKPLDILVSTISRKRAHQPANKELFRTVMECLYHRIQGFESSLKFLPILVGSGNTCKTSFCRALTPFNEAFFTEIGTKDFKRSSTFDEAGLKIQGRFIAVIDEIAGDCFTVLKKVLDRPRDTGRIPYGSKAENHRRVAIYLSTMNAGRELKEASGASRWCIVPWLQDDTTNKEAVGLLRGVMEPAFMKRLWGQIACGAKDPVKYINMTQQTLKEFERRREGQYKIDGLLSNTLSCQDDKTYIPNDVKELMKLFPQHKPADVREALKDDGWKMVQPLKRIGGKVRTLPRVWIKNSLRRVELYDGIVRKALHKMKSLR